jgi:hypothetical protein
MNHRAFIAAAVVALLGAYLVARRRPLTAPGGVSAPNDIDLEPLTITAQRLPDPSQPLEEIVITASRVPDTWAARAAEVVTAAVSEVVDVVKSAFVPRGIRNKNPGNLERTGVQWKGMSEIQTDPRFIVFREPKWGVRALARVLKTYEGRGLDTVRAIVNRWAPPVENDTSAYVTAVARALGVSPDARINVSERLPQLAAAIIKHENGVNPYSAADLAAWVKLA